MESWKGCLLWCVVVGAEISLLSNLTLKLPHFLDAWNALSLLWGWLVMLSGRYSRTAPESSLSPRWWRYGNQLSNGWITAVVDKDAHQNQMLLAFPPIRSQELGACRRRRRPTESRGTTPSLSDIVLRPLRNNRAAVEEKTEERNRKIQNVKEKMNSSDGCPGLQINWGTLSTCSINESEEGNKLGKAKIATSAHCCLWFVFLSSFHLTFDTMIDRSW